ncbi:MAG: GAF domain-containing protein [Chloroflexi bacterium]|nr:GAF domain-containing protein [Chloroflexota bacterium]
MLKRLVAFLTPPIFQDEEQARLASLLNTISLAILATFIVFGVRALFTASASALALQSVVLGTVIRAVVLFLIHRGKLRFASGLLCATLWVIVTTVAALFGGTHSPGIAGYGIVILTAGVLLGTRAGLLFTALSILGVIAIAQNESNPLVQLPVLAIPPAPAWMTQTAILLALAFLLFLMTRNLRDTLARVNLVERAQLETNRQLIALRTTLDHRAAELERAQQRLFDSEKVYETLVENLPTSIFRKDLEGRYTFVNQRFCDELGKAREEILGKTDFDLYPRARAEQYRADDRRVRADGAIFETVEEQNILSGEQIFVQIVKTLTRDAEGSRTGIQGILWDVTEQKRAELVLRQSRDELEKLVQARTAQLAHEQDLLRESEQRLRTITEGTQALLVSVDAQGHFTYANDATAKAVGYADAADLIGKPYLHFIYPADRQQTSEAYLQQVKTRQSSSFREFRIVDTAGNVKWFSFLANLVLQDDRVIGQTGVAQDITERKRAEAALQRRANEFAALYETTRDLATQQNLPTLLRSIVERAATLLAAPGGSIYLYDAARGDLEVMLSTDTALPVGTRLRLGEGMAGRVAQTREPLIVADYRVWLHRSTQFDGMPIRAVVEVPMLSGGELVGVLAVSEMNDSTRQFDDADVRLLSLFAGQAASAVRNTRLFAAVQQELAERKRAEQETRQSNQELAALNQIGQALSRLAQPTEILELIFTTIGQVLDNRNFYIALYDEANRQISFPIYTIDGTRRNVASRTFSDGLTEYIITSKAPLLLPRDVEAQIARLGYVAKGQPAECLLAVPMLVGDKVIGVITVQDYEKPEVYNRRHLELLSTFAAQAAVSVENARLFAAVQQELTERKRAEERARLQATRLQIAAQVARTVTSILDPERILPRVADLIRERFGYYHAGVFLTEESGEWAVLTASSSETVSHELEGVMKLRVGKEGMIGFVAQTGQARVAQDVAADDAYLAHPALPATRSEAALPLKIGDAVIGVLDVQSKEPDAFPPDAISILTTIADQIAIAIQNARRHAATQQRAQELERQAARNTNGERRTSH